MLLLELLPILFSLPNLLFFSPLQQTKKEEAPAQPPMNESMLKLMQMLQESPEKAASLMLLLGLN